MFPWILFLRSKDCLLLFLSSIGKSQYFNKKFTILFFSVFSVTFFCAREGVNEAPRNKQNENLHELKS